jgi:hypothetical protein
MNRCPNCAAQNREGAKFCTSCGFRLPAEAPVLATSDRSPFATTSSMPGQSEATPAAEPSSFETWNTETTAARGPGGSWEAEPLPNRAIPVDDDMLASLVGSAESHESPGSAEPAPNTADWNLEAGPVSSTAASTSIEHLLKLARDLEYGLIELAEAPGAAEEGAVATGSLRGVLDALQDEDDLIALRSAVETAQQRPRDVDVMLDLVLRADAIAAVLRDRDQLKQAIERALAGDAEDGQSPTAEAPAFAGETRLEAEQPVEGELADVAGDVTDSGQREEDQFAI